MGAGARDGRGRRASAQQQYETLRQQIQDEF
jgi:hypothetical protein